MNLRRTFAATGTATMLLVGSLAACGDGDPGDSPATTVMDDMTEETMMDEMPDDSVMDDMTDDSMTDDDGG